jgi:hemolysin activation/secretion protein
MGQTVLMLRAYRSDANQPLPPYLQPMLGGMPNVRGFPVGSDVGDTLVGGTGELRYRLAAQHRVWRERDRDAAPVIQGQRLRDQSFERAVGGGVWFS